MRKAGCYVVNRYLLPGMILLALSCCAAVPTDIERTHTTAFDQPQTTRAGKLFADLISRHPGESGFMLLAEGEDAFMMRSAMAVSAEQTLDVQYYIWEDDDIGRILVSHLLTAADRGVRVRLLLDDIHTDGKDFDIARMDSHPNIEIRLFNPFLNRNWRSLDWLVDSSRINHRMHNKVFVMDNAMAIVGGRNIGDDYFGIHSVKNFRDLDLLSVGPVVQEISSSFDEFWNSEWSIPAAVLVTDPVSEQTARDMFEALQQQVSGITEFPFTIKLDEQDFETRLQNVGARLIWADYQVMYDKPDKVSTDNQQGIAPHLRQLVNELQQEVAIESAYFIPGTQFREVIADLRQRGVRIKVLTNSLASNDVIAAHAGYAATRTQLLKQGVELFELRPDAQAERRRWSIAASSQSNLHSKLIVFDRQIVVVGTFNLDPRSANINTEIALVVHSPVLAAQLQSIIEDGMRPENSYRLLLDEKDEQLRWLSEHHGEELRYTTEPEASLWRRLGAWLFALLPIHSQL